MPLLFLQVRPCVHTVQRPAFEVRVQGKERAGGIRQKAKTAGGVDGRESGTVP